MPSWLTGFLSGVIATIIGFIFTIIWDIYKYRRDIGSRDNTILTAIGEELRSNYEISTLNKNILLEEIKVLDENKSVVTPLCFLQSGFWELVKVNLPSALAKGDSLLKIRKMAQSTNEINEVIRSRENYRVHNGAMSNYSSRLKIYDQILLQHFNELNKLYDGMQENHLFRFN